MWVLITTTLFFLIGAIDDGLSLLRKSNKGLSARVKFLLQIIVSIMSVFLFNEFCQLISFTQAMVYVFILIGTSNATNLTDGVDGLLGTIMLISLTGFTIVLGQQWMYEELGMTYVMMAAISFFLIFNWYPAKIFMGDVGSLMLGGFLAALGIASGAWWMLIGFGAIYIIETLSVMIQVVYFRFRQKRVFLMTPLHHHFELLGMSEVSVVLLFSMVQGIFSIIQLQ